MERLMNLVFFVLSMLFFSACKKEKVKGCNDSTAINFNVEAKENDGTCNYLRDKYLGQFEGIKTCQIYASEPAFSFSISPSAENFGRLIINEFPESGASLYANLDFSDSDQIILPNQTIENGLDVSEVSGTGRLSSDSISITYYRTIESGSVDTSIVRAKRM